MNAKLFFELSEDYILKMFENRVLRGRFGPKVKRVQETRSTPIMISFMIYASDGGY
jgi:hypothetical protein